MPPKSKSQHSVKPVRLNVGNQQALPSKISFDDDTPEVVIQKPVGKKRALDSLLEEIKSSSSSTQSRHDENSTTVFVGNLSSIVTQDQLMQNFVLYGPLSSIKILPPRDDKTSAFVVYTNRQDASKAIKEMDGYELAGLKLRCNWAKSSQPPGKPMYVFDKELGRGISVNQVQEKVIYNAVNGLVKVEIPSDELQLGIIHRTIEKVLQNGPQFELQLMEHVLHEEAPGITKQDFDFLFDSSSVGHLYYRWKIYSLLQGDTRFEWLTNPVRLSNQLPEFQPPNHLTIDVDTPWPLHVKQDSSDNDSSSDSEQEIVQTRLSSSQKRHLVSILKKLDSSKSSIQDAMIYCLDHADAAGDIVEIVTKSLILPSTLIPDKISRLYLVNDLLHNSSSKRRNAWQLRSLLEPRLSQVFRHLGNVWGNIVQRLKAEEVRKSVVKVLNVWEQRSTFPPPIMEEFRRQFQLGHDETSERVADLVDPDLDGIPME